MSPHRCPSGHCFGHVAFCLQLVLPTCLYSSVVERQSCKLKVLGSIPSGGYVLSCVTGLLLVRSSTGRLSYLAAWNSDRWPAALVARQVKQYWHCAHTAVQLSIASIAQWQSVSLVN